VGLTALVEVHNEAELERALKIPNIKLIGINNRDWARSRSRSKPASACVR